MAGGHLAFFEEDVGVVDGFGGGFSCGGEDEALLFGVEFVVFAEYPEVDVGAFIHFVDGVFAILMVGFLSCWMRYSSSNPRLS